MWLQKRPSHHFCKRDDDHWRVFDLTPFHFTQVMHAAGTPPGCNLPADGAIIKNAFLIIKNQTQATHSERKTHRRSWVRAAVTAKISSRRVDIIAAEAGRGPGVLALTYASYAVAS